MKSSQERSQTATSQSRTERAASTALLTVLGVSPWHKHSRLTWFARGAIGALTQRCVKWHELGLMLSPDREVPTGDPAKKGVRWDQGKRVLDAFEALSKVNRESVNFLCKTLTRTEESDRGTQWHNAWAPLSNHESAWFTFWQCCSAPSKAACRPIPYWGNTP